MQQFIQQFIHRRGFLKQFLMGAGSAVVFSPIGNALARSCGITPPQTQGPFYPEQDIQNQNDLTRVYPGSARAKGQVILLKGRIQDPNCNPVEGALVEIWQASESGRYQHSQDPNPAPLDPNFRYWAETTSDANGEYFFRTIIPGAYPADVDWVRPPHIHFKITKLGYRDLITQMYFSGQTLNDHDAILQSIPLLERNSVIVDFSNIVIGDPDGAKTGFFPITLEKIR